MSVPELRPWPYPRWFAHRGAGRQAPENTLAAFRHGAACGFRAFECDAKLSADGVPFLLHDATLDRTCNAGGLAGSRPWAELSRLDAGGWHGPRFAGEPPARLDAVAAWCLRHGHALDIEIKPTPGVERETGHAVAAFAARAWQGAALPPLLSSFSPQALLAARDAAPELPRALLLDRLRPGWLDAARSLGCVAVVAQHALLDAAVVRRLHAAGLHAAAYTVNRAAEAERLFDAGVAALVTDEMQAFGPSGEQSVAERE